MCVIVSVWMLLGCSGVCNLSVAPMFIFVMYFLIMGTTCDDRSTERNW